MRVALQNEVKEEDALAAGGHEWRSAALAVRMLSSAKFLSLSISCRD